MVYALIWDLITDNYLTQFNFLQQNFDNFFRRFLALLPLVALLYGVLHLYRHRYEIMAMKFW